jgi:hypothetical protein
MVDTIKFSEFVNGGDLSNDVTTVGLDAGSNTRFNNPWTFLSPGTTGDRPVPAVGMYYRQRLNTTLEVYEYYDPTTLTWTQLSGSGTGTVNPGVANDLAFYAANGQSISPIAGNDNAVLVTNASGIPSLSTTLPSGLSIPGAIITASIAALLSGSVVAAPVSGTDLVNKTYADSLFASGVQSLTGTTNQISFSSPTGNITASLPQDIALGSTPTFGGMTLSSIPLGASSGGTGINNGSRTLTMAGSHVLVGAFSSTFTFTNTTSVTFPTSGTLATTSQLVTPAALTKTDDTNVTLTLGGSPATALVNAASLTLGWSGQLSIIRGGTGVSSVTTSPTASAWAGWDASSNMSANNFLSSFATTASAAGTTVLTVASAFNQEITGATTQTVQMPVAATVTQGHSFKVINNSSGNVTLTSSGSNTILVMAANTTALITCVLNSGTSASSWNASYIFDNGAGVLSITGTANQVIASASTGAITLSLPQDIGTGSSPTFLSPTFTSPAIGIATGTSFNTITGVATQAEQETGTSIVQVVTPGRQQYHPSASKVWVRYTSITTTAILASYNVSSLTDGGAGITQINYTVAFSSANYATLSTGSQSGTGQLTYVSIVNAGNATAVQITPSTLGIVDGISSFAAFGDQ